MKPFQLRSELRVRERREYDESVQNNLAQKKKEVSSTATHFIWPNFSVFYLDCFAAVLWNTANYVSITFASNCVNVWNLN